MAKRNLNLRQQRRINRKHQGVEAPQASDGDATGVVMARYGKQADVVTADVPGGESMRCHIRANVQDVVTGDRVTWSQVDAAGVITGVLPRRSLMSRPDTRGTLRPLAANVTQVAIVIAPEPQAHQNLVDRYLVAIEHLNSRALLVVNKADLAHGGDTGLATLVALYRKLGYGVMQVSTRTAAGIGALLAAMDGESTVFVGQSGVGKSSLINLICPAAGAAVGELSQVAKGRHTTTTARLYRLQTGGDLIDSPGIREFGLWHLDPGQVAQGFVEFRPFLGQCKFRNCRHRNETGCAVLEAGTRGLIPATRLASYQHILNDLSR